MVGGQSRACGSEVLLSPGIPKGVPTAAGTCWPHLLLCKVVLTQLLPQPPVLAELRERGRHLAQGDDVPPVRKPVQDVVERVQGQVAEGQASVHLLHRDSTAAVSGCGLGYGTREQR